MRPTRAFHLSPELVDRFAAYHAAHAEWGVFHVSLSDGNWKERANATGPLTDEERELVLIHDALTPSQRKRLAGRCSEAVARRRYWTIQVPPAASVCPSSITTTSAPTPGTVITLHHDGRTARVTVEAGETIATLAEKLWRAVPA